MVKSGDGALDGTRCRTREAVAGSAMKPGGNGKRVRRMLSARILSSARLGVARHRFRIDVEAAGNDRGAFCPTMGEEKDPAKQRVLNRPRACRSTSASIVPAQSPGTSGVFGWCRRLLLMPIFSVSEPKQDAFPRLDEQESASGCSVPGEPLDSSIRGESLNACSHTTSLQLLGLQPQFVRSLPA